MIYFADLEAYSDSFFEKYGYVKAYALYGESTDGHKILDVDTESWLDRLIEQVCEWGKTVDDNCVKVFFHNLGGYDGHFLLPYLLKKHNGKKYKFTHLIESNRRILTMDLKIITQWRENGVRKKKRMTIQFRDSYRLWQAPLAALGATVGMPKLDVETYDILEEFETVEDYMNYNGGKDWEYLKRDVEILKKFHEDIKDFVNIEDSAMTSGSQALEELFERSDTLSKSKYWIRDLQTWKLVNESYYGGFTWQNPKYALKEVHNVHGLDITSSYPAIMRNESMPYGYPIYDENDSRASLRYYKCNASSFKAKTIPFYPFGTEKAMSRDIENKESYPYEGGEVEWYINNYLLEFLLEWYEFTDLKIEFKVGFRERYGMFEEFFDEFFAYKDKFAKTGEKAKYNMSKIFINSVYGKMIQNPERKSTKILKEDELKASPEYHTENGYHYYNGMRVENFFDDYYFTTVYNNVKTFEDKRTGEIRLIASFAPIGEKATSLARINLLKNIIDKPDALIYADTDSNYVTLTMEEIQERYWMDEEALGAWTYDGCSETFIGRRAKHYLKLNTTLNGKVKDYELKGGGFNVSHFNETKEITPEMYKQVEFTVKNGKLNSGRVPGGILLTETEYKFGMSDAWKAQYLGDKEC